MDKVIRFSVSLPEQLLVELDKKVSTQGYASRSEFTRDLIREKIVKDSWKDDEQEVIGVLTMIYTHHQNELLQRIMNIKEESGNKILCSSQVPMENGNYLEALTLKGTVSEITQIADKLSGLKGVKFTELTKAAVPQS